MDGLGFDPIGWGVETVAVGAAAVLTGAYTAAQWLGDGLTGLIDGGPGALPPQDLIRETQPPSVAQPDEFRPSPGYGPGTAAGPKAPTLAEYYAELAAQEVQTGVQTPLGPDDPNQYTQIPPVPQNDDPQAPLTNDFTPTPQPLPPAGLGQNTLISFYTPSELNPGSFDGYALKPKYKGSTGTGYRGTFDGVVASAVPVINGNSISWKARVQALNNGAIKKTWDFDAGGSPPSSGEFQFIFDLEVFDTALDLLDPVNQFGDEKTSYYSLSAPAVPNQPQIQGIEEDWTNVPVGPIWTADTAPDGFITVNDNAQGDVDQPITPPLPTPVTPQPILPVAPLPTTVNNPTSVPAVGTNGEVLKLQQSIKALDENVHTIGQTLVSSQSMRNDLANVAKEVGRIEQKTAASLGNGLGALALLDDIWNLLNSMGGAKTAPAETLEMLAACDYDANNELAKFSISYPEKEMLEAILDRVNDIPDFLQQHLAWKTPTCGNGRTKMEGDWVTIRWVSDAPSPYSNRPLRKRFRYRSKSSASLNQFREHWAGFTWQAGPVCVGHADAWWGSPQVWAATASEGKRVIRHAAREAGLDPDQVGRWIVSGSRSARYGVPGTMRIEQFEGIDWITSRDGPSGWPEL